MVCNRLFLCLKYADGIEAAIFGLTKDVHLIGTQYSWLGSIFYFGYLFVGLPSFY